MRDWAMAFVRNRKAGFGLAIVTFYVLIALAAPLITGHDPNKRVARPHQPPSIENVMGSTRMGRDVYTQFVWGTRTSLFVGFLAGFIVTALGTLIGITAGYFGGWIDEVLNFATNIILVIPQLPLLLVLAAFIGEASPMVIALIIGLTSWGWGARVTRAQALSLRQREFIQASRALGEPAWRMVFAEMLPNLLPIISLNFIGSVIYTIVTEATLEFLGLGDPLAVSWGTMLYNAQITAAITVGAWWELFVPCAAIAIVGIGLSLINFGVDEVSNPRVRTLAAARQPS